MAAVTICNDFGAPKNKICHCLFNLYAEYIMRNAGLEEKKLESRLLGEISNNFRYTDDTTLMAENEEELKSPLMKVKENEKLA